MVRSKGVYGFEEAICWGMVVLFELSSLDYKYRSNGENEGLDKEKLSVKSVLSSAPGEGVDGNTPPCDSSETSSQ